MIPKRFIVDGHCDSLCDRADGRRNLVTRSDAGHLDVPRMVQAGVSVQVMAMWTADSYLPHGALRRTLALLDAAYGLAKDSAMVDIATSMDAIKASTAAGRVAVVLSIEGAEALEGSLEVLRAFHRLGVMMMGLTWNRRNQVADGVAETGSKGGLTSFGGKVVDEMARLGMVVDVSHLSARGFWDVMDRHPGPVVASHSNMHSLCPHPRNLTDAQLTRLASTGGLVGICLCPAFVDEDASRRDIRRVADHIEHAVNLVGHQHVGLGTDFDGDAVMAEGVEDVTRLPKLFDELAKRNLTNGAIKAVAGENWLRVFEKVWAPN